MLELEDLSAEPEDLSAELEDLSAELEDEDLLSDEVLDSLVPSLEPDDSEDLEPPERLSFL
ncbi:MAG: hypothetical protein VX743_04820 [Actinomycetota bacterium]|nr:hypothetical protein [Actinomycetota bacterium]